MAGFASPLEPGRAVASPAAVWAPPNPRCRIRAAASTRLRPAAHKANESRRDALLRMVKSLETEQIKDQRRIRFVDDIYDAAEAGEGSRVACPRSGAAAM